MGPPVPLLLRLVGAALQLPFAALSTVLHAAFVIARTGSRGAAAVLPPRLVHAVSSEFPVPRHSEGTPWFGTGTRGLRCMYDFPQLWNTERGSGASSNVLPACTGLPPIPTFPGPWPVQPAPQPCPPAWRVLARQPRRLLRPDSLASYKQRLAAPSTGRRVAGKRRRALRQPRAVSSLCTSMPHATR